jgi:hypothetical protein
MWLLVQSAVLACPICFQTNNAHVIGGVRAAVGVLIAVTVGVVSAAVVFFGRVARRQ